jgi:hypothetical protein
VKIHPKSVLIFILLAMLELPQAYSQQVAIDSTIAGKTSHIYGSFGVDFRLSGGNIKQTLIRANTNLFLEGKNVLINPNLLFTQNIIFGNKLESDVFAYLLIRVWHHKKVYPVASLLYENSLIRSINLRYIAGGGLGWKVAATKKVDLELIQLIVYDKTGFEVNENLSYGGVRTHSSVLGKYILLQNRLYVEHRFFVSVLVSAPDNYRLRTFATLRAPLTKRLSLTANLDYIYESIVEERRARANYTSTAGISFHF